MTKLYLIGSLRNKKIPELANSLRRQLPNTEVFDDWYAAGPEADDYWKAYEQGRGRSYDEALKGAAARNVFAFDRRNIDSSSHALLVLPAGKSGHMEVVYAKYGAGINAAIYLEPGADVRHDVMYQFVDRIIEKEEDIVEWIKDTDVGYASRYGGSKVSAVAEVDPRKYPDRERSVGIQGITAGGGQRAGRDGDGGRFARLLSKCSCGDCTPQSSSWEQAYTRSAITLEQARIDGSPKQDYATSSRQRS